MREIKMNRGEKGISWMTKVSLVLAFTLVFSTFMYQGWYKPKRAEAITTQTNWTNVYHSVTMPGATAASFAVSAGRNRMLVVAFDYEASSSAALTATSVTYGGVLMTAVSGDATRSSSMHTLIYYLKDNAIMNGSAQTLAVNITGGGTSVMSNIWYAVYAGVNQTATPITNSRNYNSGGSTVTSAQFGTALTVNANDQAVLVCSGATATAAVTYTAPTNWTVGNNQPTGTTGVGFVASRTIPGSSGTDTVNVTAITGSPRWSQTGISMKAAITTLANGTNPSNATRAPGGVITDLDAFTFTANTGATDSITPLTVTLSTVSGVGEVRITNSTGATTYFTAVTNPGSTTVNFSGGTPIPVTAAATTFKVRITPLSHAAMPAPPGGTYTVTGTVTGWTGTNIHAGTDAGSATITIDNQSPANPTGFSGTPGDGQVVLSWTNPADADFSQVVILRNTSTITDTPVEGVTYSQGNTIGTSTVRYVGNLQTFTDTGLTNGVGYYYKIFAKDSSGNYSSGGSAAGPYTPAPVVTASLSGTQTATIEAGSTAQYIGAAFTFRQSSGTADTITALTITDTGTAVANTKLTNVEVYYESGVASCTYNGTETSINTSFDASEKIVLTSISIPVTLSPNYTCVYVVFDVDLSAVNNSTVDLEITSSADFTLSGGSNKAGTYPVALSGSTTLRDTSAPGDVTGLTATPGSGQVTLDWTNPLDTDYAGVRIRRATGATPPADCTLGTQVADVAAPGTNYVDSPLTNGQQYSYRLCSYDEVPNYSTGVTTSVTPSSAPVLSYPAAPYDDGKDPDTGDTTTDFTFKLIYTDSENDVPASGYPKIYIGDNDGYASYIMSLDTDAAASLKDGIYTNGEQYVYGPIGLGAAQDLRFYFEGNAATGDLTVVRLPSNAPTDYSTGPSVYLMQGYNIVGVPKDLGTGLSYSSVLGDDSENCPNCCIVWDSAGLDIAYDDTFNGQWSRCTGDNVETGKGYFIVSNARLDEPDAVENVTDSYFDLALDPDGGWNMISNPYNVYIKLEDIKVVRSSTEYTFSEAVTNGWIYNSIYKWEGYVTGYTFKAYNGSPPAALEPWAGYFIYVNDTTLTTLRVYKP